MKNAIQSLRAKLPPLPTSPPSHEPEYKTVILLAGLIALALCMHFSIASLTIALYSCVIFSFKCFILWRKAKMPPQWFVMMLTIISVGLIIFSYGGWNGQTAGISFLVLLVALKFLESRTVRDYFVVCLILYFLAASSFLFNSSILSIGIVLTYSAAITTTLFRITNPLPSKSASAAKSSVGLILKAIPLALFLFFFFPRVQGSFGFLPSLDENYSGLENSLVAGELASNAFSNELAFKAEFEGQIPPISALYWRAKVMTEEDNFTWVVSEQDQSFRQNWEASLRMRELSKSVEPDVRYQVLHEDTTDILIPHLDYVVESSQGKLMHDSTIRLRSVNNGAFTYSGASTFLPSFNTIDVALEPLTKNRSIPSAKIQALLRKIRQQSESKRVQADLLYRYFADNEFSYSLAPPALNDVKPLDDFIFGTKTGYCEHYASAFTTMARWLEIPARVVVGYHGGTINAAGNFVEVRYSDAHAWSEVFVDGSWVRFDATAAISPERIEFGMDALRELWDNDLLGSNASGQALSNFLNPTGAAATWRKIQQSWSNVQYQWKKWVVDYDFETQQELLAKFGINAKDSLISIMGVLIAGVGVFLGFYFWQLIPKPKKHSDLQRLYFKLVSKARRAGIEHEPAETPKEFANKLTSAFPAQTEQINIITKLYLRLSYGKEGYSDELAIKLKSAINKLSLTN